MGLDWKPGSSLDLSLCTLNDELDELSDAQPLRRDFPIKSCYSTSHGIGATMRRLNIQISLYSIFVHHAIIDLSSATGFEQQRPSTTGQRIRQKSQ